MITYRWTVSEVVSLLTATGFTVETGREPGYDEPGEYESGFGNFVPELVATVPSPIIYSART